MGTIRNVNILVAVPYTINTVLEVMGVKRVGFLMFTRLWPLYSPIIQATNVYSNIAFGMEDNGWQDGEGNYAAMNGISGLVALAMQIQVLNEFASDIGFG